MPSWKSFIKNNTLEWLLEENNPSARYFTLIDLLDKKPDSTEVKTAKEKIMTEGPVPKILNKQKPGGYWEEWQDFYTAKCKGTAHTFIILTELGADGNDKRIRQTCEFIFEHSQHKTSGAFLYRSGKNRPGNRKVIPCLTGNMLFCLMRCGYLDDPRVRKGIDWIVKYQRFDDGAEKAPEG